MRRWRATFLRRASLPPSEEETLDPFNLLAKIKIKRSYFWQTVECAFLQEGSYDSRQSRAIGLHGLLKSDEHQPLLFRPRTPPEPRAHPALWQRSRRHLGRSW